MLFQICLDIEEWLGKNENNVAVVHCYVRLNVPYYVGWHGKNYDSVLGFLNMGRLVPLHVGSTRYVP